MVLKCYNGYNPISCELVKGNPIKKINSEILENDEESYDMLIKPNTSFLVYVLNQYEVLFHYNGKDVLDIAAISMDYTNFQIYFELNRYNKKHKNRAYRFFDKSFSKIKTIKGWVEKIKNYDFKESKKNNLNENFKIFNFHQFING